MKIKLSKKRTVEPAPYIIKRKMRSKRPRRRRSQVSPIVPCSHLNSKTDNILRKRSVSALSVDSSSYSYFVEEASCDSSRVSDAKKRQYSRNRGNGAKDRGKEGSRGLQPKEKESESRGHEIEVSESSCVESNSGADFRCFGERSSKLKKAGAIVEEAVRHDSVSLEVVTRSDVSCVEQSHGAVSKISLENKVNDVVSNRTAIELSEISKADGADANFTVSNSYSIVDQKTKSFAGFDSSSLACSEQLSFNDVLDYSSTHETVLSELQSEIFVEDSDLEISDYTPSIFLDSGSEFSERSIDESPPSLTYSLFLEFKQQLSEYTTPIDSKFASRLQDEFQIRSALVRFEDADDEESYVRLRERERRQVFLRDYAEEYRFTTDSGDLVLQQRSLIVQWIVEQCSAKELQRETMFLGVSLLDRFLSKGFFKSKRSLQIVGIACLALATRIEENQPYNSVRQKNFCIDGSTYSRSEVVAMEWLVMEVLNFQCFLPTVYNFLWFYLKAANADADVEKRAKYLAVLALSDHEQLRYWPSTVAAGLVLLASLGRNGDASCQRLIQIHLRSKDNDLAGCLDSLECWVRHVR